MSADPKPFVSIVMPALNEEHYIETAIRSVAPAGEALDYEILVMDGGSTDRTTAIVTAMSTQDPRIKLLPNPRRVQSAAMNIAAREAEPRARYLLRADCHAHYPPGFAERNIAALRQTGAASVVVTMHSQGRGCMQRAIAAASNSRLGNGGSAHRRESRSGYVHHGHHAAFDRETYLALGGYDESFRYNEDAEYDQRVIGAGKRIYLLGDLAIRYFPRVNLGALARQYRNYGWGRANTLLKHRARPRLRQMLPVLILLSNAGALALSPLVPPLLVVPLLYAALCCGWGLILAAKAGEGCLALSGPAAMVMHMSWAFGFLSRLASAAIGGRTRLVPGERGVRGGAGRSAG
jgi:succinoglycan biosynthesis protein ExoA